MKNMNLTQRTREAAPLESRTTAKAVNFYCAARKATSVYLVGDFNGWNSVSHPMRRRVDGWWFVQIPLTPGHHRYRFLVDGKPMLDPRATGIGRNDWNDEVSIVAVS